MGILCHSTGALLKVRFPLTILFPLITWVLVNREVYGQLNQSPATHGWDRSMPEDIRPGWFYEKEFKKLWIRTVLQPGDEIVVDVAY